MKQGNSGVEGFGYRVVKSLNKLLIASVGVGLFAALLAYASLEINSADKWRLYFRYYPILLGFVLGAPALVIARLINPNKEKLGAAGNLRASSHNEWVASGARHRLKTYIGISVLALLFGLMGWLAGGFAASVLFGI